MRQCGSWYIQGLADGYHLPTLSTFRFTGFGLRTKMACQDYVFASKKTDAKIVSRGCLAMSRQCCQNPKTSEPG